MQRKHPSHETRSYQFCIYYSLPELFVLYMYTIVHKLETTSISLKCVRAPTARRWQSCSSRSIVCVHVHVLCRREKARINKECVYEQKNVKTSVNCVQNRTSI